MKALTGAGKNTGLKNHLPLLSLFILTNLIFCLLYWKFISGSAVYMYADIGNDSLSSSYPLLTLLSRLFHNGGFTSYTLTDGLGSDITSLYLQYLNPVKLLMLLFPAEYLPQAILLSTLIQVNLLSLFGWIFFRSLLGKSSSGEASSVFIPVIPSLAWSFSAYVVLWGQNYSFLTCILMFTMTMALIELYLADSRRSRYLWFIPMVGLFLISNYYFLFMTAEFAFVYVILRALFSRFPVKKLLRKIGGLLLMGILGILTGFISLLPIINNFLASNRLSRLADTSARSEGSGALTYGIKTLLTFLGRLFSVNTFGPGSGYTGFGNYYEAAILSVSALFFFGLIYLILKKASRLKTLFLVLVSVLLLLFPKASSLLNMNESAQRWSFMLCFAQCMAVGFFLRCLFREKDEKLLFRTLIVSPLLTGICLLMIFLGRKAGLYSISKKPLFFFLVFFMLYEILFFLCFLRQKREKEAGSSENPRVLSHCLRLMGKQPIMLLLMLVLAAELVIADYPTVNDRMYLSKEAFYDSYYNDGSYETAAAIQAGDEELYRMTNDRQTDPALYGVTATADKMFANEGMVNDYNGLSVYTSTLSSTLTSYADAYLSEQGSSNFFIIDKSDYYLFTLLGGRYVFGTDYDLSLKTVDPDLYEETLSSSGQVVFKNKNALPFGYLYTAKIDTDDYLNLNALSRMRLVTRGFYLTEDLKGNSPSDSQLSSGEYETVSSASLSGTVYQLSDLITSANDCEVSSDGSSLTITPTGADPYLVFQAPLCEDGETLTLDLSVMGDNPHAVQLFTATAAYPAFSSELCRDYTFTADKNELIMTMADDMTVFRLDTIPGETVTFDTASLTAVSTGEDFSALAASEVSDITFESQGTQAVYTSQVQTGENAMLCVPLIYSSNWTAYVDGEKTEVQNINGGLTGVALSKGSHSVRLVYEVPHFKAAVLVSLTALLLFAVVYVLGIRKDKASGRQSL